MLPTPMTDNNYISGNNNVTYKAQIRIRIHRSRVRVEQNAFSLFLKVLRDMSVGGNPGVSWCPTPQDLTKLSLIFMELFAYLRLQSIVQNSSTCDTTKWFIVYFVSLKA